MEWCGSRKEEFGDWPDKLSVSAYTRYVDEYHEKVLEINEMTRQQVNTVFENVAEIDARYAARLRECQEKIKGQIAIVKTMTEFMDSMANGNPNMALLSGGGVNEGGDSPKIKDKKIILANCFKIRHELSLSRCKVEDCMKIINDLYSKGFISEDDYNQICDLANQKGMAAQDEIQGYFNHVITTVYIYNCLQTLTDENDGTDGNDGINWIDGIFTPEECYKDNEIFRYYGITDCNSIACMLSCASGESGRFTAVLEKYEYTTLYTDMEKGAGYLQVTGKDNQLDCLQYIYDMYGIEEEIETGKEGYAVEVSEYPWEATAWYWAVYGMVSKEDNERQPLNDYVMERLGDNGGELTLGIVLTAECFVHGDVNSQENTCGKYNIDIVLNGFYGNIKC